MSFRLFGQEYFEGSVEDAADWIRGRVGRSSYVCVSNVHTAMNSLWNPQLAAANTGADLKVPDGRPLSVLARLKGHPRARQVRGADLMLALARRGKLRHYFYGAAPGVAARVATRLKVLAPLLKVAGAESPPFRALSSAEERAFVKKMKHLKVDLLWVGLGAPKQEIWMASMRGKLPCAMIGVGAAFDYYAGSLSEAPRWMQHFAMEWLYRLAHEPRRLWKRYFLTNTLFLVAAPLELLGLWPEKTRLRGPGHP